MDIEPEQDDAPMSKEDRAFEREDRAFDSLSDAPGEWTPKPSLWRCKNGHEVELPETPKRVVNCPQCGRVLTYLKMK